MRFFMKLKGFAVFIAFMTFASGCGGDGVAKKDHGFENTFKWNFFEIGLPDGFTGASNTEGAVLKGSFTVKIAGFRSPGSRPGQLSQDTDRFSQEGITLGNFETDEINGHKAFILDSKVMIAAIFPFSGKSVFVLMTNQSGSPDFLKVAPKMLSSFEITNIDYIPDFQGDRPVAPRNDADEPKVPEDKQKEVDYSPKTPAKPNKAGLAREQYFETDKLFFQLRPFYLIKSNSDTSIVVSGFAKEAKDNQMISIFLSPPARFSSKELATQIVGGSNPVETTIGSNTFQKLEGKLPDGTALTYLFYSTREYSCKIILQGSLGLTGYTKEILETLVFK